MSSSHLSSSSSSSSSSVSTSRSVSSLSMSTRDAVLARTGRLHSTSNVSGEKDALGQWQTQRLHVATDKPLVGEVFETPDIQEIQIQQQQHNRDKQTTTAANAHAATANNTASASASSSSSEKNSSGAVSQSDDIIRLQMKPSLAFQKFAGDVYQVPPSSSHSASQVYSFYTRHSTTPHHPSTTSTWENIVSHTPLTTTSTSATATATATSTSTSQTHSQSLAQALNRRFEHPVARLQRLASELDEFQADLHLLVEEETHQLPHHVGNGTETASAQLAQQLGVQIRALQKQLNDITLDKKFKPLFQHALTPQGQTEESKEGVAATSQVFVTPHTTSTLDHLLQQINNTEGNQLQQVQVNNTNNTQQRAAQTEEKVQILSLLPEFESRLNQLEKVLGLENKDTPLLAAKANTSKTNSNPNSSTTSSSTTTSTTTSTTNNTSSAASTAASAVNTMNSNLSTSHSSSPLLPLPLSVGLAYPDVVTGLRALHHSILALSPSRIEFLSRKLRTLLTDAEHIIEKENVDAKPSTSSITSSSTSGHPSTASTSSNLSSSSYASLVLHVASVIERWDHLSLSLPLIIERLSALKVVHESSALALGKVAQIETDHATIVAQQQQAHVALNTLQDSLRTNTSTLKENFDSLEARLAKVQEKLNKLS